MHSIDLSLLSATGEKFWGTGMDSLRGISLFNSLTDSEIQQLDERCIWRDYTAGEMIIDHEDDSHDVRFVMAGEVRVVARMSEGREVIFTDHGAGTYFGELSALDGGTRSANVSALVNTRLCIMPTSEFLRVASAYPNVALDVMRKLTGIVRRLSDRLAEFTFLQAKHRIFAELLRTSRERNGHPEQRIITPPPLQRDIADRIASRREVVSREMKTLERDGIIEKTRGGLVILDPQELRRRASEGWTSG